MNRLFNMDNKLTRLLGKLANLVFLQLLTLICCLPIITTGASLTAMHKVLLQLKRDEEGSITKAFFHSFRINFRQATIIWIFFILLFLALYLDRAFLSGSSSSAFLIMRYLLSIILILAIVSLNWIFVVLSRYNNSIWGSLRSAILVGISHPLHTLVMVILMFLPLLALYLSLRTLPLVVLLGVTLPGYLQTFVYSRIFDKLENASTEASS